MPNYGDYRVVKSGETTFLIEEWQRVWWKLWLGGDWKYLVTRYNYELALATVQYLKDSKKPGEVVWKNKEYRIVKRWSFLFKEDFSVQRFNRGLFGGEWKEICVEYKLEKAHDFVKILKEKQALKDKKNHEVVWIETEN